MRQARNWEFILDARSPALSIFNPSPYHMDFTSWVTQNAIYLAPCYSHARPSLHHILSGNCSSPTSKLVISNPFPTSIRDIFMKCEPFPNSITSLLTLHGFPLSSSMESGMCHKVHWNCPPSKCLDSVCIAFWLFPTELLPVPRTLYTSSSHRTLHMLFALPWGI